MNKFRINELTTTSDNNSNVPNGMRSPSSSISSSQSINHNINQPSHHSSERLSFSNNMPLISEPTRGNYFYQTENDLESVTTINWRDEADGSEEDELRLNPLPNPMDPMQPTLFQSNLFGHQANPSIHNEETLPFMIDPDMRNQALNNNSQLNHNKNADNKEKRFRETELYLNRIEDLLDSFKKVLKSNRNNNNFVTPDGNNFANATNLKANLSANRKSQTLPKMTNANFSFAQTNQTRQSNQLNQNLGNFNLHNPNLSTNEFIQDANLRNNKNRKVSNNRQTISSIQNELQTNINNLTLQDNDVLNETTCGENNSAQDNKFDQFFHLINIQINTLRKRLEQLSNSSDPQNNCSNFQDIFQNNAHNANSFNNDHSFCDINNCYQNCDSLDSSIQDENLNYKINQQFYQLLMHQNQQIQQQHQLIMTWVDHQQKWLEKQSRCSFKYVSNNPNNQTFESTSMNYPSDSHLVENPTLNNAFIPQLNNQTVPRNRTNNFLDNFKSHSCQNKFQTNAPVSNRDFSFGPRNFNNLSGVNHCSRTCANVGPCNKNILSQSFSTFNHSLNKSKNLRNNNTQLSNSNSNINNDNSVEISDLLDKKLNVNVGSNIRQLNKLLSMVEKLVENGDPSSNAFNGNDVPSTSKDSNSNEFQPFDLMNRPIINNPSFKRKKVCNVDLSLSDSTLENICEFDDNEDDNSTDLIQLPDNSTLDQQSRTSAIVESLHNGQNAVSTVSSFQVPVHISPQTGAIRKKPMSLNRDINFIKFAATDNQKLSMQQNSVTDKSDNGQGTSEIVRPLMPAEGRSSEPLVNNQNTNPIVSNTSVKVKLTNSTTHKYSTRPPITGAGNESSTNLPIKINSNFIFTSNTNNNDSLTNSVDDDDIKWNKFTNDIQCTSPDNSGIKDKETKTSTDNKEDQDHSRDTVFIGDFDNSDNFDNNNRQLNNGIVNGNEKGSSKDKVDKNNENKQTTNSNPSGGDSTFIASQSTSNTQSLFHSSSSKFSLNANQTNNGNNSSNSVSNSENSNFNSVTKKQAPKVNGGSSSGKMPWSNGVESSPSHNGADNNNNNSRFVNDDGGSVRASNGHRVPEDLADDGDQDDDKDTDIRILSLAGNAVEVRSSVRLSGDGEQGL